MCKWTDLASLRVTSRLVVEKNIPFFKVEYHVVVFICLIVCYLVFSLYDTQNTVKLKSQ